MLSVSKGSQRAVNGFRAHSEYAGICNALRIDSVRALKWIGFFNALTACREHSERDPNVISERVANVLGACLFNSIWRALPMYSERVMNTPKTFGACCESFETVGPAYARHDLSTRLLRVSRLHGDLMAFLPRSLYNWSDFSEISDDFTAVASLSAYCCCRTIDIWCSISKFWISSAMMMSTTYSDEYDRHTDV